MFQFSSDGGAATSPVAESPGAESSSSSSSSDAASRLWSLLSSADASRTGTVGTSPESVLASASGASGLPLEIFLSLSVGVAGLPGDGETEESLLAAAERALDAARRLGRSQTVLSDLLIAS